MIIAALATIGFGTVCFFMSTLWEEHKQRQRERAATELAAALRAHGFNPETFMDGHDYSCRPAIVPRFRITAAQAAQVEAML